MSGQQQRKVHSEHNVSGHEKSGQHRQHLHNPTGYTDEVADEEREFMMQAERSAGLETDTSQSAGQNMKKGKGGLEGQGSSGAGSSMGR
ncbi:hypothetical protein CONLIGDRAFT_637150 [Coniochaeta ligniaria NRRL 30616]|uniref:Uncharacterized protein n=1 Tax=Coniochaeta ligniaria NRRL 30616 TaxID=1408157 RepID=A0A1J7J411_9PEZI|nr:hypothetical protein CONLIGDRAFT_637150 [Coniochaeta ligniaria NRRL 30616]